MPKTLLVFLLAAALTSSGASLTAQAPESAELEAGIRLAQEGEFEQAVLALDGVVQRLGTRSDRARDRARALVYLSVSHLGLNRRVTARERLLEALRADPRLELSSREFPPSVMEFFEEVRRELRPEPQPSAVAAQPKPSPTPRPAASPQPAATAAPAKKGGGSGGLILLGLGAAGAGVALAARGSGGASPPAPMVTPTPQATPTPDPNTIVTPISGFGPVQMTFVSADPPPGTTISGCGSNLRGCPGRPTITFSLRSSTAGSSLLLNVRLTSSTVASCFIQAPFGEPFTLEAGVPRSISKSFDPGSSGCAAPFAADRLLANLNRGVGLPSESEQNWTLTYRFVP